MPTVEHERSKVSSFGGPAPARRILKLPLAPSLEKRRLQTYLILMLLDGLTIVGSLLAIGFLYIGNATETGTLAQINLFVPLYWTAALVIQAYSIKALTSLRFSQLRAIMAIACAFTLTIFVAFFTKSSDAFSRPDLR
jgi:polysaccharide biosynthesis protein PslA